MQFRDCGDSELYERFIDFVRTDIQRERHDANRKLINVFLWCFIIPAVVAASLLLLVKFGFLPRRVSRYLDWLIVVFPAAYGVYMISADAIRDLPMAYKSGGIAATLGRALTEEQWRARVCAELRSRFLSTGAPVSPVQWNWVTRNYEIFLANLQNRTRYLTALAGAVFFLIFQGIDALDTPQSAPRWSATSIMGWFEASTGTLTQFFALGIFLLLLFVSGNQVYLSLVRYLQCAEMVRDSLKNSS